MFLCSIIQFWYKIIHYMRVEEVVLLVCLKQEEMCARFSLYGIVLSARTFVLTIHQCCLMIVLRVCKFNVMNSINIPYS